MSVEHVLLLGDIHANELALEATVAHARERYSGPEDLTLWFLGDLFGRGPEPVQTWRLLADYAPEISVAGNHDWGVLGKMGGFDLQTDWVVILKHREELGKLGLLRLDAEGRPCGGPVYDYLAALPLIATPRPGFYVIHGGADRPLAEHSLAPNLTDFVLTHQVFGYVKGPPDLRHTLDMLRWLRQDGRAAEWSPGGVMGELPAVVVVGHTHKRTLYWDHLSPAWVAPIRVDYPYQVAPNAEHPVLISPGSVGFPRESPADLCAGYAVLRLEEGQLTSVTFHGAPYDRQAVVGAMETKGYPDRIISYLRPTS